MNSQCPQCGQPVSDDFGVIVCPHCQAVLFVDLNGNIQLSDATSAASRAEENNEILEEAAEQEEAVYATNIQPPEGLELTRLPSASPQEAHFSMGDEPALALEPEPIFAEEDPEVSEEQIQSVPPLPQIQPRVQAILDEALMEDTSPVDDFVDQEAISGPMTYTVTIERIDTKDLRAQLRDVLDDPKFHWSSADLMRRIRQGKITLKNLSPVKASVLISGIKDLPLKISWTQQVFK